MQLLAAACRRALPRSSSRSCAPLLWLRGEPDTGTILVWTHGNLTFINFRVCVYCVLYEHSGGDACSLKKKNYINCADKEHQHSQLKPVKAS